MNDAEKQKNREKYQLLSMMRNGELTFQLAPSCQKVVNELQKLDDQQQIELLEQLKDFAPKPVTATMVRRRFEAMFPGTVEYFCDYRP